ncbi:hypothetical protein HF521_001727 [Silurus meridionalis]|uniref:Death domain-containing protein n=1 Tax=Silurus meridionalis TaxID=175797 RepID=A0A8T0BBR0_SILME|nr:hypothetical protein HF521_001727 [Silurus meridionalis]
MVKMFSLWWGKTLFVLNEKFCQEINDRFQVDLGVTSSQCSGWVNLTYQCLLEILKMHNNLEPQQFVNGLEIFDNEQVLHSIPDKDACIHHLHRWFSRASEEQVHKLPDQLQKAGMKNLSQKIRNRIHNIQIEVNLCNNKVSNHI